MLGGKRGGGSQPTRMRSFPDDPSDDEERAASILSGLKSHSEMRSLPDDPSSSRNAVREMNEARLQSILSFLETYGIPRKVAEPYVVKHFDLDI